MDTQNAPAFEPQPGSINEAQSAIVGLLDRETTPETEAASEEVEAKSETEAEATEVTESEDVESEVNEATEEEEVKESDGDEETEVESEEDPLYRVRVDGEDLEVNLEELRQGYSRQADYTRKSQALAENRKNLESEKEKISAEMEQVQQERSQYQQALQYMQTQLSGELEQFKNINWTELQESDPFEYMVQKDAYRDAKERMQNTQVQQHRVQQKQMEEAQQQFDTVLKQETKSLEEKIPEWREPEKQEKIKKELLNYGRTQGFKDQELGSLVDHRSILILRKAMMYDALQQAQPAKKRVKNKPKVVKAGKGTSKSDDVVKQRSDKLKRLQKSGSVNDAASAIFDMID